jgi:hypothetical protein
VLEARAVERRRVAAQPANWSTDVFAFSSTITRPISASLASYTESCIWSAGWSPWSLPKNAPTSSVPELKMRSRKSLNSEPLFW